MTGIPDDWEPSVRARLGEVIAGRYRLDSLLGRGGMGCVYRAQHVELNESVVIKLIDPGFALDPLARARFRLEAKALMRLRHAGVVTMHEFGEHEGGLFIAMELLEGHTLTHEATADAPVDRILGIFYQLALVLEAAHAAGVIHRDLKPENVMLLSGAGGVRVKLMDFGLAHLHEPEDSRLSATGVVLGTPSYMSPEQCFGRGSSPASDIYSLGVMLFEILSGRRPFDDPTPAVVMSQHMFVAAPKLDALSARSEMPAGLTTLVEEMLAKKPEVRPTATQFLRRLEAIEHGSDQATFGASSSARRLTDAGLDREQRALPQADARLPSDPTILAAQVSGERPRVALIGFGQAREGQLASALAVNGLEAVMPDPRPGALTAPLDVQASIISGHGSGEAIEALRGRQDALPALVVDVAEATAIPALIRAGASDVLLGILGDDAVATKVWRLLRRKR